MRRPVDVKAHFHFLQASTPCFFGACFRRVERVLLSPVDLLIVQLLSFIEHGRRFIGSPVGCETRLRRTPTTFRRAGRSRFWHFPA
jgi:hypothetical protein